MKTGKALGLKKGDFVFTGAFPGIIIGEVHTRTPLCEVWGLEHESGSVYASELRKLRKEEFVALARQFGFDGTAHSKEAKKALGI
jgi:hypothetical protein